MIYDTTSLEILEQVYLKPGIHKRELSKQIHLSMPSIDFALKKMITLVKEKKSGNRLTYFLNYSNETLTPAVSLIEQKRLKKLPKKVNLAADDFLTDLKEKPLIAVIFGSYSRADYSKDSDIDILLVFQKVESDKQIENSAKKISMRTNTKLNPVYLDYESFRASFHDSSKEFFRNLRKDKIIILGFEWWRRLENEET